VNQHVEIPNILGSGITFIQTEAVLLPVNIGGLSREFPAQYIKG